MAKINWKKIHRFQENKDWCGPAIIQMVLKAVGFRKSQKEIAKDVYIKWWGTTQQMLIAYLSRFFKNIRYKRNSSIADISRNLNKGYIVIVNWWDDLDASDADGHYTIVSKYDSKNKMLTMLDSSNSRQGIWKMSSKDFKDRWYDALDVHGDNWIDGWMLWIDVNSRLKKPRTDSIIRTG